MSDDERRAGWADWHEWRESCDLQLAQIQNHVNGLTQRVIDMELQHASLKTAVDENTALTREVSANTHDIVEWTQASVGAFKVLEVLGTVARWAAGIIAAVGAATAAWHQFHGK